MIDRTPGLALGAGHAAADLRASRTKRSRLGEPAVARGSGVSFAYADAGRASQQRSEHDTSVRGRAVPSWRRQIAKRQTTHVNVHAGSTSQSMNHSC